MGDNSDQMLLPYLLLQGARASEWLQRTDAELLAEYLQEGSDLAFAALVYRHGPMVWRVCWQRLRHYQDAEDAFQATFLVLARRAADIRPPEMLANWLYGVARQTAQKASLMAARRRHRETSLTPQAGQPAGTPTSEEEWVDWLHEEVSRLPEKFRAVVVLCDLEGQSRKEAARQLGVPEGTVAGWLARARQLLHKRLARRGLTLTLAGLTAALGQSEAAVPFRAMLASVRAASRLTAGESLVGAVSTKVAVLAQAVMRNLTGGSAAVMLAGAACLSLALAWSAGLGEFFGHSPVQVARCETASSATVVRQSKTVPVSDVATQPTANPDPPTSTKQSAGLHSPKESPLPVPGRVLAASSTVQTKSAKKPEPAKPKEPPRKKSADDDDDDTYKVAGVVSAVGAQHQTLTITCWQKQSPHQKTFRLASGVRVWHRGQLGDLSVLKQGMWVQLEVSVDDHRVILVKLKAKPKWAEDQKPRPFAAWPLMASQAAKTQISRFAWHRRPAKQSGAQQEELRCCIVASTAAG